MTYRYENANLRAALDNAAGLARLLTVCPVL